MLLQQIERWAELAPQRLAHKHREQCLTYAELKAHSDTLAVWLVQSLTQDLSQDLSQILSRHLPIVVYGHKESEMPVLFLACLKAGHPYIPVDISVPPERLLRILETSGAAAVLSPRNIPDKVKQFGVNCHEQIHLSDVHFYSSGQAEPAPEWQLGPEDVCYIIFTSGSTGEPKGVQITQRALESFVNWVNREYRPRPEREVFLNQAPFSFDLSVMDLYMSMSNGGTLWSVDQEHISNARELFQSLSESHLSYWVSTPSFVEMCLMEPSFREELLPQLRYFLFCGEILANDAASRLLGRFPQAQVINLYGPTECTVAVSGVNITTQMAKNPEPLPVGQNSTDCRICICDPTDLDRICATPDPELQRRKPIKPGQMRPEAGQFLKTLASGEKGEIVIAGPNVSTGYLNRPELTQHSFFTWAEEGTSCRAYRTGDLGCWQKGQLFYLGRRDFQIKLHGYRIELGEIEEQLRKLPEVENAVVLPIVRRGKNAALQAFIKLSGDRPDSPPSVTSRNDDPTDRNTRANQANRNNLADTADPPDPANPVNPPNPPDTADMGRRLRQQLSQVLSSYMVPQRYIFTRNIPLTANGKVDRTALLGGHYDPV